MRSFYCSMVSTFFTLASLGIISLIWFMTHQHPFLCGANVTKSINWPLIMRCCIAFVICVPTLWINGTGNKRWGAALTSDDCGNGAVEVGHELVKLVRTDYDKGSNNSNTVVVFFLVFVVILCSRKKGRMRPNIFLKIIYNNL